MYFFPLFLQIKFLKTQTIRIKTKLFIIFLTGEIQLSPDRVDDVVKAAKFLKVGGLDGLDITQAKMEPDDKNRCNDQEVLVMSGSSGMTTNESNLRSSPKNKDTFVPEDTNGVHNRDNCLKSSLVVDATPMNLKLTNNNPSDDRFDRFLFFTRIISIN